VTGSAYDDFMGGGGKNFPFDNIGDMVTGTIISVAKRQQTDLTTGEPKTWPNGEPRYMFNIQLQTSIRDDEFDDGVRSINVKWQSQKAVQEAVRRAGAQKLEPGGQLSLKYTGNGPRGNFPQPPKLWGANYVPPSPGDEFMHDDSVATASRPAPQQQQHYPGSPQPADPPEWARPPAAEVGARSGPRTSSTLDSMRNAPADLPGDRSQYGY
jgi:hypothetical protein